MILPAARATAGISKGSPLTVTYDPHHPAYLDESDVRHEMSRVFDVCAGCRRCVTFCDSFPNLFSIVDSFDKPEADQMTPAQQDRVVEPCFQCKLCALSCPFGVGRNEAAVDFPRLMLRADAMRDTTKQLSAKERLTTQIGARTDLLGTIGSRTSAASNRILSAETGGITRKVLEKTTGLSSARLVPTFAKQRFTTWFKRRPKIRIGRRQARVALFPTCLVEYQEPSIGHDLVKVYERNGIEVSLADAGCCGAPWLHSGDRDGFIKVARKVTDLLAAEVRRGNEIVVPQPTCSYVLKHDYPAYVGTADAELVAEHTFDACEFLMRVHRTEGSTLDTDFDGDVPNTITYHAPCHLRAQNVGLRSRDLLKLTGANVTLVQQCSGMGAMWGLRAENADASLAVAAKLGSRVSATTSESVAGDCHHANIVIVEQTGRIPSHPIQLLARAYGIPEEEPPA